MAIVPSRFFSKNIEHVLHIENCTSNLLSIGKLSQELNCEIIFSKNNVFFQDFKTKKMIGEGSFQNGLYILNISKFGFHSKNQELGELWHKRIGHSSDRVLKNVFNFSHLDCSKCEIFKLAKHMKLLFVLSDTKSNKKIELIHSDVWGPAPVESYNDFLQ
jgi:GAG-pre-integrase domain